jgi:molecular chaperone DnaK
VQPSYGLTDEQVEGMILDSFDNAEEDFRRRQVIEARAETTTILTALEKAKKSPAWGQLTTDEKKQIAKMEKSLAAVNKEEDYQAIRKAIDALNQGTMRLAELMMDSAVSVALKGKTMDEADMGEGPTATHPMAKAEFE